MFNMYEYLGVNWEHTADNIRGYIRLKDISIEELAKVMGCTERTIKNWCSNKSIPSLEDLIILSSLFNVSVEDIIVINGQINKNLTIADVEEAHEEAKKVSENNGYCDVFSFKEGMIFQILHNEYYKVENPVKNLSEFLCILPLVNPIILSDVIKRISRSFEDKEYINEQVKYLYNTIDNIEAKKYVEFVKKYYYEYPNIYKIDDETKNEFKIQKSQKYFKEFQLQSLSDTYKPYEKTVELFCERIIFFDTTRFNVNNLEKRI